MQKIVFYKSEPEVNIFRYFKTLIFINRFQFDNSVLLVIFFIFKVNHEWIRYYFIFLGNSLSKILSNNIGFINIGKLDLV